MSLAWSKDMELDPGTFGGSPACHILVDMMNHNMIPIREKHRVLSFINDATYQFKWLSTVKDYSVKERAMVLMRDDILSRVDQMPYPPKFNSHLKNVITHHFRRYLKEETQTIAP
jgi:hypothetical protein